jgi:bacillithiol biosynthesis cysteine-adding enzyme BshC
VEQAYRHTEFQTATQALLHEFFGRFGVVVVNTNDASLKREFLPYMRREITEQLSEPLVQATQKELQSLGFKTQAFARPINIFYMRPQSRERIERTDDGHYTVVNTDIRWTEAQILAELDTHPERFSPNVVMRPVYQEAILPNIAYIGGGGEIAYWIERKTQFEAFGLPLPLLVRRDSAMWLDAKQRERLEKLQLPVAALFQRPDLVINTFIAKQAGDALNLDNEAEQLKQIFESLAEKARQIDPTLEKTMLAEGAKATQNLEQLGSRIAKAAKQKQETAVKQLDGLLQKLCPGGGLQERSDNFLPYILRYGDQWLDTLLAHFDPLRTEFLVLMEE